MLRLDVRPERAAPEVPLPYGRRVRLVLPDDAAAGPSRGLAATVSGVVGAGARARLVGDVARLVLGHDLFLLLENALLLRIHTHVAHLRCDLRARREPVRQAWQRQGATGSLSPRLVALRLTDQAVAFHDDVLAAFPELGLDAATVRTGTSKLAVAGVMNGSEVMLKVLRDPLPDQHVAEEEIAEPEALQGERFRREVVAMRRIRSPRVVRILDGPNVRRIGLRKHLWYVEPRYPATLDERFNEAWTPAKVITLLCGLVEGLEAMQTAGQLVHRDIKPGNIAIDGEGGPVLLDLGAVLFAELTTFTVGLAPHTKPYAAPEQLFPRRGSSVDIRADMFALGVVAYQLLVGQLPSGDYAADPAAYMNRAASGAWNRDALLATNPGDQLVAVMETLLGARPHQRYRKLAHLKGGLGCQ